MAGSRETVGGQREPAEQAPVHAYTTQLSSSRDLGMFFGSVLGLQSWCIL
jgi:hypothetical protein